MSLRNKWYCSCCGRMNMAHIEYCEGSDRYRDGHLSLCGSARAHGVPSSLPKYRPREKSIHTDATQRGSSSAAHMGAAFTNGTGKGHNDGRATCSHINREISAGSQAKTRAFNESPSECAACARGAHRAHTCSDRNGSMRGLDGKFTSRGSCTTTKYQPGEAPHTKDVEDGAKPPGEAKLGNGPHNEGGSERIVKHGAQRERESLIKGLTSEGEEEAAREEDDKEDDEDLRPLARGGTAAVTTAATLGARPHSRHVSPLRPARPWYPGPKRKFHCIA